MPEQEVDKNKILLELIEHYLKSIGFTTIILDKNYLQRYKSINTEITLTDGSKSDIDIVAFNQSGKLVLLCECTIAQTGRNDEVTLAISKLNKIQNSFQKIIEFIKNNNIISEDQKGKLEKYLNHSSQELKTSFSKLYFNFNQIFEDNSKEGVYLFDSYRFIYFNELLQLIGNISIYELYSYLDISPKSLSLTIDDYQKQASPNEYAALKVAMGPNAEMDMFVFKIQPSNLLQYAKVIRNKKWDEEAYQRLLVEEKLKKIQSYLIDDNKRFPNNIIIALPASTTFHEHESLGSKGFGTLSIENCFNSLSVIDGQHRLFAFAKRLSDKLSKSNFENLGEQYQLIVTGVQFKGTSNKEAELFLDINTTQTKINKNLVDTLKMITNPEDKRAIAKAIILKLNERDFFKSKFKINTFSAKTLTKYKDTIINLSEFRDTPFVIKSILGFGLVYLTKKSGWLFKNFQKKQTGGDYVTYTHNKINLFFTKINEAYKSKKNDADIRSGNFLDTVMIVGYLKALYNLEKYNIKEEDYGELFSTIAFEKKDIYKSNRWNDVAKDFINELKQEKLAEYSDFENIFD